MQLHSKWIDFVQWLSAAESKLPHEWPPELPPATEPDFWQRVSSLEAASRPMLSGKIREIVNGTGCFSMTALEAWLFRRRVVWALECALKQAAAGIHPSEPLKDILIGGLITSWESDGWLALGRRQALKT